MLFKPMNQDEAEQIACWEYEEPYSFYNAKSDEEDLQLLLNSKSRENTYFSVYEDDQLIGFFTFLVTDHEVEIGLGLKPELTGRGIGKRFLDAGIQYATRQYKANTISLAVATFNKRAITVYERAGFEAKKTFWQSTNGGKFEFIQMIKKI